MLNLNLKLKSGDRIELFYEDAPATIICATVGRLLSDRDEGMGIEVEDYIACWMEITVDEPSDIDAKQLVLLGTDFQCRLNGRPVTLRMRGDSLVCQLGEDPTVVGRRQHVTTATTSKIGCVQTGTCATKALSEHS